VHHQTLQCNIFFASALFFILPKISYVYIMKKKLLSLAILILISAGKVFSQNAKDTTVYLLTCGPGTETYSIYGHSALRVEIATKKLDRIYNWGVFDFNTPNFAWKFAKGRLDYMVIEESKDQFLRMYFYENRYVQSQIINLNQEETNKLIALINDNLKPENRKYRYDFFYDDCSTRIRDLLEKSIGDKLLYPPPGNAKLPTFRSMVGKCQAGKPWLNFGIDLIMGSPGDKKASFRDQTFLPIDLQENLSETVVNRNGKMTPLLQNPVVILDFEPIVLKPNFLISPAFVFTLLLIGIIIFSAMVKSRKANNRIDIVIYSVFSVLAVMMIFFNFFTDHQQMKLNLNIIWLNPFIIACLISVLMKKESLILFRILFIISTGFLSIHFLLPQAFNIAFLPLVVILIVRSSVRANYSWNPLTMT